jgi:TolB protein
MITKRSLQLWAILLLLAGSIVTSCGGAPAAPQRPISEAPQLAPQSGGPAEATPAPAPALPEPADLGSAASPVQLTSEKTASFQPAWSPDGRQIVFIRRVDGWRHIFTMNADGTNVRQVTSGEQANIDPAWSSDGRIAFACNRDETEQICVIDADGTGFAQLTNTPTNSDQPAWSPDSRRIAFWNDCGIYLMNADGSNIVPFAEGSEFDCYGFPAWSPDGKQIAFRLGSSTGSAIYVMNVGDVGGSDIRKVTGASGNNRKPAWSPDGSWIAFERERQIYRVRVDGTSEQLISSLDSIADRFPAWSPAGDQIAFESKMGSDRKYGDDLYQIVVVHTAIQAR